MKSRTTRQFRELFAALPSHVQGQAREAYRLFQQDSTHPGLRFKKVNPDPLIYSARVGIGYRAVGAVNGDEVTVTTPAGVKEYEVVRLTTIYEDD